MSKLAIALSTLIAVSAWWAVPLTGTAHQRLWSNPASSESSSILANARLTRSASRGLLVSLWIQGSGPYTFVVDTGAGTTLVTRDLVSRARLQTMPMNRPLVGGLSSRTIQTNQKTTIRKIGLGSLNNEISTLFSAAVVESLPEGLDGILDPTEAFQPFGYSIDLPNRELQIVDFNLRGLRSVNVPKDGAVVKWVRKGKDHRPFVRLGDGRLALIDTGSSFGLAVSDGKVVGINERHQSRVMTDLGGGVISARRVSPITVNIGSLLLKSVPTDVLFGAPAGTPVILGRDALYPFRLTFDPTTQLIEIAPAERD